MSSAEAATRDAADRPPSALSNVLFLLGQRRLRVVILAAASLVSGLAESAILAILAQAASALVDGSARVHIKLGGLQVNETVGHLLLFALGLAVIRLCMQAVVSVLPALIAAEIQGRVRSGLFRAYTQASWSTQARDREGQLQEMLSNQLAQATSGALSAAQLVTALLTFVILVVSAVALNLVAALVVLAAASAIFVLLRPLSTLGRRSSAALSQAWLDYAGAISEAVRLAEATKVFGVGPAQQDRVDTFVERARRFFVRTQVLGVLPSAIFQSLIYLTVVGGLAILNAAHAGHIAALGAVVLVLVRAGTYGQQAQSAYQGLRQSLPYVDRLRDLEAQYVASAPLPGHVALHKVDRVSFERVGFSYDSARFVLQDVSFTVRRGETIGIVGPSGAGKSTLVQILLQLRAPSTGSYLVNGVDAASCVRTDWYRRVAFVPQEPQLLHASVADNIRYFRNIDDAAVEQAARLAAIHDDVVGWPNGYNTIIGPRADAISGGQQQRICLARALAARPEVLVLDEPTSALDPYSEAMIHRSLESLKNEITLFIVAHRMSTADICDRIMVIVAGHLQAFDTLESVRVSSPYYRDLADFGPSQAAR